MQTRERRREDRRCVTASLPRVLLLLLLLVATTTTRTVHVYKNKKYKNTNMIICGHILTRIPLLLLLLHIHVYVYTVT